MYRAKIIFSAIFLFFLTGCIVKYTLVEDKRVPVGEFYSVDPQISWSGKTIENKTLWTMDGANLERIVFLNNIKDGETLFGGEKSHLFKKGMNIIEIAELFSNSMQTDGKWLKVKTQNLNPQTFGPFDGFSLEMTMVSEKGLPYKGLVSGAVIEEKLFIVFYLAVEMHYYPKYVDHFRNIVLSIEKHEAPKSTSNYSGAS